MPLSDIPYAILAAAIALEGFKKTLFQKVSSNLFPFLYVPHSNVRKILD